MPSKEAQTHDVDLSSLAIPAGWLIGPRSYLVDRILADLERVWLPETQTGGGTIHMQYGPVTLSHHQTGLKKRLLKPSAPTLTHDTGWLMDLRPENPDNWAHFLNIHLALLALACRTFGFDWRHATVILPSQTPAYIKQLVECVGLTALYTDAPVSGTGVTHDITNWNVLRGERHGLLTDPAISPVMAALRGGALTASKSALPTKVFLSRTKDRTLQNEAEIEALLAERGYTKVYPERLPVADQLQLLTQAEHVVAVHGAGLAPLLYRDADAPPLTLVELFPVGHITNVYRAFAVPLGAQWCGVRGQIEPTHLSGIYDLKQPYLKHSLRSFLIDPASLTAALDIVATRARA